MARFILRRLGYGLLVLAGVVTIVFFLFNILPGDPARMMLGQRADVASVETIRKDLGLDQPLSRQYLKYVNDLSPLSYHNKNQESHYFFLDKHKYGKTITLLKPGKDGVLVLKKPYLRRSYQSKRKVNHILSQAFVKTAVLAVTAMTFAVIFGLIIGVISALKKDGLFDKSSLVLSVLGMSIPSFFAAILIGWFFAFILGEYTGLNMIGSMYTVDNFGRGKYLDLQNLILPALTLGIRPLAIVTELTRSSMLDVLSQDYIKTAKAKGLRQNKIIMRHALKNALNPVITATSGWFASLLAGAVFVEYIFDWKGLGVVIVKALEQYDFPVIMGAVLFISVILIIINILIDIIYSLLDPRVLIA
ncbi:MAG: ABC transporter permease [Bacteroidales bacterium]|nr:ABC transporter permease [Bacteroidales bacterium]